MAKISAIAKGSTVNIPMADGTKRPFIYLGYNYYGASEATLIQSQRAMIPGGYGFGHPHTMGGTSTVTTSFNSLLFTPVGAALVGPYRDSLSEGIRKCLKPVRIAEATIVTNQTVGDGSYRGDATTTIKSISYAEPQNQYPFGSAGPTFSAYTWGNNNPNGGVSASDQNKTSWYYWYPGVYLPSLQEIGAGPGKVSSGWSETYYELGYPTTVNYALPASFITGQNPATRSKKWHVDTTVTPNAIEWGRVQFLCGGYAATSSLGGYFDPMGYVAVNPCIAIDGNVEVQGATGGDITRLTVIETYRKIDGIWYRTI